MIFLYLDISAHWRWSEKTADRMIELITPASSQSLHFDVKFEAYLVSKDNKWSFSDSVRWKPRAITMVFKHFEILITVTVHSIESGGKNWFATPCNPGECGMTLIDCEVHFFSTSRKNWRDFGVWHCLFEGQSCEFLK
jgi:hypothetical protein